MFNGDISVYFLSVISFKRRKDWWRLNPSLGAPKLLYTASGQCRRKASFSCILEASIRGGGETFYVFFKYLSGSPL
jgi:hypothetical protein